MRDNAPNFGSEYYGFESRRVMNRFKSCHGQPFCKTFKCILIFKKTLKCRMNLHIYFKVLTNFVHFVSHKMHLLNVCASFVLFFTPGKVFALLAIALFFKWLVVIKRAIAELADDTLM